VLLENGDERAPPQANLYIVALSGLTGLSSEASTSTTFGRISTATACSLYSVTDPELPGSIINLRVGDSWLSHSLRPEVDSVTDSFLGEPFLEDDRLDEAGDGPWLLSVVELCITAANQIYSWTFDTGHQVRRLFSPPPAPLCLPAV
jgi:hypothetical protein